MRGNNSSSNSASGGIGFVGLLTIVFIVLKLCHIIDWSWLWVLSPIWITFCFFFSAIVIAFLIYLWKKRRREGNDRL